MICTILKKSCVDLISNLNFTAMHVLNFVLIANSKDGYCSFSLYSISHLMIHVHLEKVLLHFWKSKLIFKIVFLSTHSKGIMDFFVNNYLDMRK